MLRYKTQTRPGLVVLYDIWLGNRAGLFFLTTPEPTWDDWCSSIYTGVTALL